jgi:hypothetical protein
MKFNNLLAPLRLGMRILPLAKHNEKRKINIQI